MIHSQIKYINPKEVVECVLNEDGTKVFQGEQMDLREYYLPLMEMLKKGFETRNLIKLQSNLG